ncbi:signal transduction histidine kinase/CheY-like chemotaxis protein [Psychrobacter sp. PL15]|uniref:response regulator n=1 Tax=Psychrobacter sp. PL15 TaxID=3071719 RepID=UPI002DF8FD56|nr:signal transduction histidine kinase/CheY-like chemotaxis protein [Psychrobacter sp. PL15]
MEQFQSLKRLLLFYTFTLLIMLILYYVMLLLALESQSQQHSKVVFNALKHELIEHSVPTNIEIETILTKSFFQDISYQLIFTLPSGQTYVYRYKRPYRYKFTNITLPTLASPFANINDAYTLTNNTLTSTIKLESGHQVYIVLRHQPAKIDWLSYQLWLPLMAAIMLFILALIYMLKRHTNWVQLLQYTEALTTTAKDAYAPPPFIETTATSEFSRLGHALSRVNYQLHNNHRRIKNLSHRLERLVDQAPLPMLMIMRHGQISFFNQRFEQIFSTSFQSDANYQLTDFVNGKDESTQLLLQKLITQRVTRTLLVYGIENKQAYQLHITPWFGEHGQVHGFTVLLNSVNELVSHADQLQQQNQQLQQKLTESNQLKSVIGHKLRAPLDAIIVILEQINPNTLSAKQREVLSMLTQSSHSMLAMLNDMLDMVNTETGKKPITNEPVDIFKLGQDISDLMTDSTRRQGLELLYTFDPYSPRYIDTDGDRLRQILLNLLDNAIKFTTSGYVALIIEPITTEHWSQTQKLEQGLTVTTPDIVDSSVPHWIRFSVQDTGMGIIPARQQLLSTYFSQAKIQVSQPFDDIGSGLATSNSFAHLLGGFIELDSTYLDSIYINSTYINSTYINNTYNEVNIFTLYLPCRRPNYQPVYHFNTNLTHIHLFAIVSHKLYATSLQRLCQYLSMPVSIYTSVDKATLQQLTEQLAQNKKMLSPILLLDYETSVMELSNLSEDSNKTAIDIDSQKALDSLLAVTSLPKILLSMKPERRISSTLLDKFNGFLSKPLDSTLLLSELMRLTQPVMRPIAHKQNFKNNNSELSTRLNNPVDDLLLPLILVVEDSLTNQKIICKLLSKFGYRTVVAEDGQQALDQLQVQRQDIALILMDCRMPVMDGLQATQAIRAQGDDIPIVALTANNTTEDRDACIAVGMDEFLSKPIDKLKLQAILQDLIKV